MTDPSTWCEEIEVEGDQPLPETGDPNIESPTEPNVNRIFQNQDSKIPRFRILKAICHTRGITSIRFKPPIVGSHGSQKKTLVNSHLTMVPLRLLRMVGQMIVDAY